MSEKLPLYFLQAAKVMYLIAQKAFTYYLVGKYIVSFIVSKSLVLNPEELEKLETENITILKIG